MENVRKLKVLTIDRLVLIHNIHNPFNILVKKDFPNPWNEILIIPILKSGEKYNPSNYSTILISLALS